MTDTKTTIAETDHEEDQNKPSDARIILGPLVKYAAMGLVLVSIIITTAVMLDRQFNDIDREVAELEALHPPVPSGPSLACGRVKPVRSPRRLPDGGSRSAFRR